MFLFTSKQIVVFECSVLLLLLKKHETQLPVALLRIFQHDACIFSFHWNKTCCIWCEHFDDQMFTKPSMTERDICDYFSTVPSVIISFFYILLLLCVTYTKLFIVVVLFLLRFGFFHYVFFYSLGNACCVYCWRKIRSKHIYWSLFSETLERQQMICRQYWCKPTEWDKT